MQILRTRLKWSNIWRSSVFCFSAIKYSLKSGHKFYCLLYLTEFGTILSSSIRFDLMFNVKKISIFWLVLTIFLSIWCHLQQIAMLRPGFEPGICDSKGRNAWPDYAAFGASTPPELLFVYFKDIIKSFLIFWYYTCLFQNVFLLENNLKYAYA